MTRTGQIFPSLERKAKDAVEQLSRPGPYPVLRGDLGIAGVPGVIYAPESGLGLPAAVFAHDWLQPISRYTDLLRHLASWGIVVAAPNTQRGPAPSALGFAADLRTTLDILAGVRLGEGKVSVDARRTALIGHGVGAAAAVIAAAERTRLDALVTIAPMQSHPNVVESVRTLRVPTLHIVAGEDSIAPAAGNVEVLAEAAPGPVWVRTLPKATHASFLDNMHWSDLLLSGKPQSKVRRITSALVTAFLLRYLDDRHTDVLIDGKVPGTELSSKFHG